ncbi:MAG: MAPEG family protein [Gammaproteobacteria bacterium]|nr:MAPEG family protein [Gammaproteobacteria bacterium]
MKLTQKQAGVLSRIFVGAIVAIAIVACGSFFNPFFLDSSLGIAERLSLAIQYLLLPVIFLVFSIGRLAKHRFFTPEDIDGGGFSNDSEQARLLQSLLQNTLEQFCIASSVYLAWAAVMPGQTLSVIPLSAIAFSVGRVLFFTGLKGGAPSRALGFALTFYPSVAMLICILSYLFWLEIS